MGKLNFLYGKHKIFINDKIEKNLSKIQFSKKSMIQDLNMIITYINDARSGFTTTEILITNLSEDKLEINIFVFHKYHKLILCDDYPSYFYGNLTDLENIFN